MDLVGQFIARYSKEYGFYDQGSRLAARLERTCRRRAVVCRICSIRCPGRPTRLSNLDAADALRDVGQSSGHAISIAALMGRRPSDTVALSCARSCSQQTVPDRPAGWRLCPEYAHPEVIPHQVACPHVSQRVLFGTRPTGIDQHYATSREVSHLVGHLPRFLCG